MSVNTEVEASRRAVSPQFQLFTWGCIPDVQLFVHQIQLTFDIEYSQK